jgi:omega-6 fatty acid desaturase (delta-12 desaturase)
MRPSDYKPSDSKAFAALIVPILIGGSGFWLTFYGSQWSYYLGQFLLSIFFLQTFLLLHECGHLNFFKTRFLNNIFGTLFGFFTLIPFYSWQQVHGLHHRWTGWRDLDPTTAPTAHASKSKIKNGVVNVAWKLFIPLFYLAYKIGNYWNLGKIRKYVPPTRFKKIRISILLYLIAYVVLFFLLDRSFILALLPAFIFSLIWKELVIMTQHSHVDMPLAEGREVKPFSFIDQIKYTRSFFVPTWISHYMLFNVNLHEAHHAYPGVPAYYLGEIDINQPSEPKFLDWLYKAKSMKGEDYIFRTSKQTGKKF